MGNPAEGWSLQLGPQETTQLIRWAASQRNNPDLVPVAPYVVIAELPYSDRDNEQQTPAHVWAFNVPKVTGVDSAKIAKRIIAAANKELQHIDVAAAYMPTVPESIIEKLPAVAVHKCRTGQVAVHAAVASLCEALGGHTTDPIANYNDYWDTFTAITPEQRKKLHKLFNDYDQWRSGRWDLEDLQRFVEETQTHAYKVFIAKWARGSNSENITIDKEV